MADQQPPPFPHTTALITERLTTEASAVAWDVDAYWNPTRTNSAVIQVARPLGDGRSYVVAMAWGPEHAWIDNEPEGRQWLADVMVNRCLAELANSN